MGRAPWRMVTPSPGRQGAAAHRRGTRAAARRRWLCVCVCSGVVVGVRRVWRLSGGRPGGGGRGIGGAPPVSDAALCRQGWGARSPAAQGRAGILQATNCYCPTSPLRGAPSCITVTSMRSPATRSSSSSSAAWNVYSALNVCTGMAAAATRADRTEDGRGCVDRLMSNAACMLRCTSFPPPPAALPPPSRHGQRGGCRHWIGLCALRLGRRGHALCCQQHSHDGGPAPGQWHSASLDSLGPCGCWRRGICRSIRSSICGAWAGRWAWDGRLQQQPATAHNHHLPHPTASPLTPLVLPPLRTTSLSRHPPNTPASLRMLMQRTACR